MNAIPDLKPFRAAIRSLAAKHHAENVRLFGSVARGQATAASDIDLLVHFVEGASLLDQVGLKQKLETLLGCPVDVGQRPRDQSSCPRARAPRRRAVMKEPRVTLQQMHDALARIAEYTAIGNSRFTDRPCLH